MDRDQTDGAIQDSDVPLGILEAVELGHEISQRSMALELNIALGLVNAYLKKCIKKGLVKVRQAPKRRFAYYLTPQGFAEKSRLTARYLSYSFDFFRSARHDCDALIATAAANGWARLALVGASDATEVAVICATDGPVKMVAVIDPTVERERFAGLPVYKDAAAARDLVDAVILTELVAPADVHGRVVEIFGTERVLVPAFLRRALRLPAARRESDAA